MAYLLVTVFLLSLFLTWYLRHYALARNILDIPNSRSSHLVPMPRGGGLAFIITFLVAIPFIAYFGFVVIPVSGALVGAGLFVAALGFFDDHGHIAAHLRLLGHFSASIFVLYWLGGMPSISLGGWILTSGVWLNILMVIYLVWLLNLYNFMDGIDGIAGVEALSVCLGGAFIYWLHGDYALIGLPMVLAAAVAGFLWWNFPSARIFMGDAGSGFLGLILGILSIQAAAVNPQFFWSWLILLGVFIVDTTVTLLCRLHRGCKLYEAHRNHAYQHAVCYFGGHFGVTFRVLMINIFWLLPMAILVATGFLSGSTGLFIAYVPLIILAVKFKAGREP